MERIRKSLLFIFLFLVGVSFNVKAESFEYYITNTSSTEPANNNDVKKIKRGDTIIINAMLFNSDNVTDYKINSGKLTIRWDEKFVSLQEVNGKYYNSSSSDIEGLKIGVENKSSNKLTLNDISSTGTLKTGMNKIVEFKFLVLESAKSDTTKIYQMDGEDSLRCLNTTNDKVVDCGDSSLSELKYNIEKSTENRLSSLKINGKELEYFNENTKDYDIQVESDIEKVNIEVTKKDSKSTITGDYGENIIKYGETKLSINVISESGIQNTYHINITRLDARSTDNTLKSLTLSSGEITFKPSITDYTVNVDNNVEKITITSSLTDSKARFEEDYSNKEIALVEGSNKVEIKVIAESGDEKVYTLNINRALSSNNSLKSLKINDEKIELKENEFIYNIILENEVEEVVIKAEPNDTKATVDVKDQYPLQVGDNEISITITAASGAKASYILNITRKKLQSKDSMLTGLKIKGYNINFKPTVTSYDLKVDDDVEQLDITATPADDNATIEIEGNKDLIDGSIIKINVKAEDGTFTRYFISIDKGSSGISPIIIIIIVLLLLLGGCIGLIFYRKKKSEEKEFEKLEEDNESPKEETITEGNSQIENNEEIESNVKEEPLVKGAHEYIGEHESLNETNDNQKDVE